MIPLRDDIPSRTTPFVNYALITLCAAVFLLQLLEAPGRPSLIEQYGMVPVRVTHPDAEITFIRQVPQRTPAGIRWIQVEEPMAPAAVNPWLTLLTCVFLHGSVMHFLGNMWFLWIFGDNVEDRYGHVGYLIFYLASGLAASLAHYLIGRESTVPTIGASGAIAGVMGAYFILYPHARVQTLVPGLFLAVQVPASVFLGVWFLIQFYQGTLAAGTMGAAGVAWWAHIGGFAAGWFVTRQLSAHLKPKVTQRRPNTERTVVWTRRNPPW